MVALKLLCIGASLVWATGFVASCYIVPAEVRKLPRNHPEHVKQRVVSIAAFTVVAAIVTSILLGLETSLERFGLHPDMLQHLTSVAYCLALIALLFVGHICTAVARVHSRATAQRSAAAELAEDLLPLAEARDPAQRHVVLRNYAFAPLAEELVFRGIMWAWLAHGGVTPFQAVVWGPSLFAVAHLHHMLESVRSGRTWRQAAVTALVQLSYTWVFGSIAWVMLLQSGSIVACTAAHILCNCFGLPDVSFLSKASPLHPHRHALLAMYVFGLVAFCAVLVPVSGAGSQHGMWP